MNIEMNKIINSIRGVVREASDTSIVDSDGEHKNLNFTRMQFRFFLELEIL